MAGRGLEEGDVVVRTSRFGRIVGISIAAGAMGLGTLPMAAKAGPVNTWAESTVRTAAATVTADNNTTVPNAMDGGEPSIGYDTVRNAAMYGSSLNVKRLTFDDTPSRPRR
jgi:hypothetical protein